jgi:hypothetical protein
MFVPCSIQQSAALAIGRLANYSDDLAEAVVQNEILPQLVSIMFWSRQYCNNHTVTILIADEGCCDLPGIVLSRALLVFITNGC